jgi:hypothetical protein
MASQASLPCRRKLQHDSVVSLEGVLHDALWSRVKHGLEAGATQHKGKHCCNTLYCFQDIACLCRLPEDATQSVGDPHFSQD